VDEIERLWMIVAQRAGFAAVDPGVVRGDDRTTIPVWEWLAAEYHFLSTALEVLHAEVEPDRFLRTLSLLSLPQYLRGFSQGQQRDLADRALKQEDAWWQLWMAPPEGDGGTRGPERRPQWAHELVDWRDVCAGSHSFVPIRLGPYVRPVQCKGFEAEVRVTAFGGPGVEDAVPASHCMLRLPGVTWPAFIDASVVRTYKQDYGQVVVVFDAPNLRWDNLTDGAYLTPHDQTGPGRVAGPAGYVVAGMTQAEMEILIAAHMEVAGILSRPDRQRVQQVVEQELVAARVRAERCKNPRLEEAQVHDSFAGAENLEQEATRVWAKIVGLRRRPRWAGSLRRYLRLVSRKLTLPDVREIETVDNAVEPDAETQVLRSQMLKRYKEGMPIDKIGAELDVSDKHELSQLEAWLRARCAAETEE